MVVAEQRSPRGHRGSAGRRAPHTANRPARGRRTRRQSPALPDTARAGRSARSDPMPRRGRRRRRRPAPDPRRAGWPRTPRPRRAPAPRCRAVAGAAEALRDASRHRLGQTLAALTSQRAAARAAVGGVHGRGMGREHPPGLARAGHRSTRGISSNARKRNCPWRSTCRAHGALGGSFAIICRKSSSPCTVRLVHRHHEIARAGCRTRRRSRWRARRPARRPSRRRRRAPDVARRSG